MPFTDEEVRKWHADKRRREQRPAAQRPDPITTCYICHQPFGRGEGHIGDDWSVCLACDDD